MSKTVADEIVHVLETIGVQQIFGLIADSLNPLADSVRRSKIEWVGVRHEEGAALAAAGQAKLTGRLGVCAGSTGPGSTHLVAGLYEAARDHAPVLALSGDMARAQKGTDFFQTTEPDLLFRDVALYTQTISTAGQAPGVVHAAIAAAYAGPGVAHLTLPVDVLSSKATGATSSLATLIPRGEILPNNAAVAEAARRIDEAGSVVIVCGHGAIGTADLLRALSDRLKAPLVHSVRGKEIMAFDDPRWMGELGVIGSARPTLKLLLDKVAAKTDGKFFDKITHERAKWDAMLDKQADPARSKNKIHPQAVARIAGDLAKPDAIFVFDTGLNTLWSANWIRQNGTQRIIGSFNNAAVGTSVGQGNGVQALDRTKQVIVLTGDGGFNMLMGEFMTAVQHKLPIKVIVYNNSALGLITLEAESIGLAPFREAIEFPNPDFAALARACGAQGFTAKLPGDLRKAIADALACEGPAIVDCVVAADEVPNLPHIEASMVGN